jgi:YebC/PmpR family DNA-binding regulatory protein
MAGHSKWANIKHKKAREDAKKGKVFTRLIRELTVAAKEGGGDLDGNAHLRLLVEKAREANMPQDNVTRAIKRGTGELEGVNYEEVRYEGYGPKGIAVLVETLTDNKNRTVAAVRHAFAKLGGNLGESGSVAWMFEHKGVIRIAAESITEDDVLEKLIDYDIEDVQKDDAVITVTCAMPDFYTVKTGVEDSGFKIEDANVEWVAKDAMPLEDSAAEEKVYRFLDALEELDDVQNIYANVA